MLVQSKYMQHTEAVLKNPMLFGDYRNAKIVGHLTSSCLIMYLTLLLNAFPAHIKPIVCVTLSAGVCRPPLSANCQLACKQSVTTHLTPSSKLCCRERRAACTKIWAPMIS